jgi:hypothetical protein
VCPVDGLRLFYYERLTGKHHEQDGLVFGRFFGADHWHRYFGDHSAGLIFHPVLTLRVAADERSEAAIDDAVVVNPECQG